MKHWAIQKTENGHGGFGLVLVDTEGDNANIVSIEKQENGLFRVCEECDGYYGKEHSKECLLAVLDEAKEWVERQ